MLFWFGHAALQLDVNVCSMFTQGQGERLSSIVLQLADRRRTSLAG